MWCRFLSCPNIDYWHYSRLWIVGDHNRRIDIWCQSSVERSTNDKLHLETINLIEIFTTAKS
jgi:hypothetical protein